MSMRSRRRLAATVRLPVAALLLGALAALPILAGCSTSGREPSEPPGLVLEVPLGKGSPSPGYTPDRVGGAGGRGPASLAVGGDGTVYLLDSARGRVLAYRQGQLAAATDLPFLGEEARDLLESGGRLYVCDNWVTEYEVTLNGAVTRTARYSGDEARSRRPDFLGTIEESLYPRPRTPAAAAAWLDKGPGCDLGRDSRGNLYRRRVGETGPEIVRLSPSGAELLAAADLGEAVDWYLTPEGAVYCLAWRWGEGGPPLGGEIQDLVVLNNVWRFLSLFGPARDPSEAPGGVPALELVAYPQGGEPLNLKLLPGWGLLCQDRCYPGPTDLVEAVLYAALYTPVRLAEAARTSGVVVAIPDLPGVERELGEAERSRLAVLLQGTYRVGPFEPPQPLEAPFPRYLIRLQRQGQDMGLALAGDSYLYLGEGSVEPHPYDARLTLGLDTDLAGLLREWLPVPEAHPGEVGYLYRATQLTITEDTSTSDLTRWKDTVVRALLGVKPQQGGLPEPPSGRLEFTFTVEGAPQVVAVDAGGFTYAGRRYERTNLLALGHLRGVP